MLDSVSCRNFRSLQKVDVPLAALTALVGPNGAGKSALLRAIDLAAGPVWPSLQRLRFPHDFTGYDDELELAVQVDFHEPIWTEDDRVGRRDLIHALRVRCRPYKRRTGAGQAGDPNFDYDPLDAVGDVPLECTEVQGGRPRLQRPRRVTTAMRDHAACVLIDHRRAITQHLPGTRGSVLSRLLQPALRDLDKPDTEDADGRTRRQLFAERYELATDVLRTPYVQGIETTIDETARRALGFMSGTAARNARVFFRITDPVNPYASLRIIYQEDGLDFPAEDAGLGIQSAIVVGIFEALRTRGTSAGTILIDEPEMYLHPQAQRHFHSILVDLVERLGTQVIYSTHSPVFADAGRFEALRVMRRPPGSSSQVAFVTDEDKAPLTTAKAQTKLLTEYDTARSEALFANAVLLVEGKADLIAARGTAARMGIDLDGRNLTVMECNGKTAIPFHARLCEALGIPVCALYDDDQREVPQDADDETAAKISASNRTAAKENAKVENAVQSDRQFVCHPSLEAALGIGRDADNKPAKVAAIVQAAPRRQQLPQPLVDAVECLDRIDLGRAPTEEAEPGAASTE